MKDKPWFPFYWKDWQINAELEECSLAAKGLLIDIMAKLWPMGGKFTTLKPMDKAGVKRWLIQKLKYDYAEASEPFDELIHADRISFDENGVLYCRKLVIVHEKQAKLSAAGKKGGNPRLKPEVKPPLKAKDKDKDIILDTLEELGCAKENIVAAYREFDKSRREAKRPKLTATAIKQQVKKMRDLKLTEKQVVECLENSIANGYQGVFPENTKKQNKPFNDMNAGGKGKTVA